LAVCSKYSLYEVTVSEGLVKQRRLPDQLNNLADRCSFFSRLLCDDTWNGFGFTVTWQCHTFLICNLRTTSFVIREMEGKETKKNRWTKKRAV